MAEYPKNVHSKFALKYLKESVQTRENTPKSALSPMNLSLVYVSVSNNGNAVYE